MSEANPRMYTTRRVEVQAVRFDPANLEQIQAWMKGEGTDSLFNDGALWFASASGLVSAREGDYIVQHEFGFASYIPPVFGARFDATQDAVEFVREVCSVCAPVGDGPQGLVTTVEIGGPGFDPGAFEFALRHTLSRDC